MPLTGKISSALVIGASGGIGSAITDVLRREAACEHVRAVSRRDDGFDLTNEESIRDLAQRLQGQNRSFDLIFNATGVLEVSGTAPEKSFREIDPLVMQQAMTINSVGAAMAFKHFMPLLRKDGPAFFGTLSARVGSIGDNNLGGWMSYRASKAALNQIVRCAAIEEKRRNKNAVIISLHPGTIKTPLTEQYAKGRYTATPDEAAINLINVLTDRTPAQSGGFFDYAGKEVVW